MTRRVAVVYPSSVGWMIRCMDGVWRYAREHGHWHLLSSPRAFRGVGGPLTLADMRGWKGDGIIALIDNERELRNARKMGIHVVNLGSWCPKSPGIPPSLRPVISAGFQEATITHPRRRFNLRTDSVSNGLEQHWNGNNLFNVMCDCVRLELDDSAPFDRYKKPTRKRVPATTPSNADTDEE